MDFVTGGPRPEMPVTGVTWNEAARFTNWLNTSQGLPPAYKFNTQPGDAGYDANVNIELWIDGVTSGTDANTAVYLHADEQGPSDVTQAGGRSPFGAMGSGGNEWEWHETDRDLLHDDGSADELSITGFRVASIPEPSSQLLGLFALAGVACLRRLS